MRDNTELSLFRKIVIAILSILIILTAIVGISYAKEKNSTYGDENSFASANISLVYSKKDYKISIGKVNKRDSNYLEFYIKKDAEQNYAVYLKIQEEYKDDITVYLTEVVSGDERAVLYSNLEDLSLDIKGYKLYKKNEESTYRLRMFSNNLSNKDIEVGLYAIYES